MKRASTHWLIALASALPYIRIVKNWAFFLVLSLQAADRLKPNLRDELRRNRAIL